MNQLSGTQLCWESCTGIRIHLPDFKETWNFVDAAKSPSCDKVAHTLIEPCFTPVTREVYTLSQAGHWPQKWSPSCPTGAPVPLCSGLQAPPSQSCWAPWSEGCTPDSLSMFWAVEKEAGLGYSLFPSRHLVSPLLASQTGPQGHRGILLSVKLPEEGRAASGHHRSISGFMFSQPLFETWFHFHSFVVLDPIFNLPEPIFLNCYV